LAEASYDFDFSTSPGTHRIGVSITSAKGIRGYNIWDLNFVSDSLRVFDLLTYPNPYRGGNFYITFKLTKSADVRLRIYTPTGKVAIERYFMNLPPGFNSLNVPINSLSNGIYVALVEAKTREEKVKNFTRFVVIR
ncbi:MAG: T9SS type A sorting domain-containing protein, partial [candidate division WOR-3 bacterium]